MITSLIYGMTRSEYREQNYIPMDDGWRLLRDGRMPAQDLIVFRIEKALLGDLTPEAVCEAVFVATNAPDDYIEHSELCLMRELNRLWLAGDFNWVPNHQGEPVYRRALSVGDTVTIEGLPSLACEKRGWREI